MKFIHTADLHLGSTFMSSCLDKNTASLRKKELFESFYKIVDNAKLSEVEILFISGDLFENDIITASDFKKIINKFDEISNVKIFISPGNHDYYHEKSFYNIFDMPSNVTIFKKDVIHGYEIPHLNTVVYGFGFNKNCYEDVKLDFPKLDPSKINILVMHCDIITKSNYLPIDKNYLASLNFDYYALGHIHKSYKYSDNMIYPGSPEPLDFSEKNSHGFILGDIDKNNCSLKLIKNNCREFITQSIDVSDITTLNSLVFHIKKSITGKTTSDLYRIILTGCLDSYIDFNDIKNSLEEEIFYIELINETTPDYDIETLYQDNKGNIIGSFIEKFKDTYSDNELERKALYLGLNALLQVRSK